MLTAVVGQVLEDSTQTITQQGGPLLSLRPQGCLPDHPEAPALLFGYNPHPALNMLDPGSAGLLGTITHTSTPSPKAADAPEPCTGCPKASDIGAGSSL